MGSEIKKILLITDAWHPQVSGVVTTYDIVVEELSKIGIEVCVIHPGLFISVPTFYPDIRLGLTSIKTIRDMDEDFQSDAIHIATEGTLGLQGVRYCKKYGLKYTTSFHTKFPDYLKKMLKIPVGLSWKYIRHFHKKSTRVITPSQSIKEELSTHGINHVTLLEKGVHINLFKPREKTKRDRPVLLYVGRVSAEKSIEDFLDLKINADKHVVGDGPILNKLRIKYALDNSITFWGMLKGEELAKAYSNADIFVFPSKTDTYGIVLLEAMASGLPIAAYPVAGPKDVLLGSEVGVGFLNDNLEIAVQYALDYGDPEKCIKFVESKTWKSVAIKFLSLLTKK